MKRNPVCHFKEHSIHLVATAEVFCRRLLASSLHKTLSVGKGVTVQSNSFGKLQYTKLNTKLSSSSNQRPSQKIYYASFISKTRKVAYIVHPSFCCFNWMLPVGNLMHKRLFWLIVLKVQVHDTGICLASGKDWSNFKSWWKESRCIQKQQVPERDWGEVPGLL